MIELAGVTKRYGGRREVTVFEDAEIALAEGDVAVVTGACGSGKTTLLRLLCGLELADAGSVRVFGHDVARLRRASIGLLRRRIGLVPQELELLDDRSALANVALALEVRGLAGPEVASRAAAALGDVGLAVEVDVPVRELSTGERQRVALARALVGDPAILLADEPTAHLDDSATDELLALLGDRQAEGRTALVVTSDPHVVEAAAICGWRHLRIDGTAIVELREGEPWTEVTAGTIDPTIWPNVAAIDRGETPNEVDAEVDADDGVEAIPNVVPFPLSARLRGGGAE